MKYSSHAELVQEQRSSVANKSNETQGMQMAFADNRDLAIAQRYFADSLQQSPIANNQQGVVSRVSDSPFVVMQRKQLAEGFGESVQRVEGLEEEKEETPQLVQRQSLEEEEEPLQGKFSAGQSPIQLQGETSKAGNRTGMPNQLKAGIESPSGNNSTIQMKISGSPTIEEGDKLQHGALIEEFTKDEQPKSIQVPDGPAWFTRQKDVGLKHGGTPFNLHVPLTRLTEAGHIYVHKLVAAKELGIITFENHDDAKTKLTEDHLNDEFGGLRNYPSFTKQVALTKEHYEKKLPASNTGNMADIVLEQSEDSGKDGYRYKEDMVRHEPEVVIHETEGNVTTSDIVQYNVSAWEVENEGFSRTIESVDHQDKYKQVSEDKNPKANFGKVL